MSIEFKHNFAVLYKSHINPIHLVDWEVGSESCIPKKKVTDFVWGSRSLGIVAKNLFSSAASWEGGSQGFQMSRSLQSYDPRNLQQDPLNGPLNLSI